MQKLAFVIAVVLALVSVSAAQQRPVLLWEAEFGDSVAYEVGIAGFTASDGSIYIGGNSSIRGQGDEFCVWKFGSDRRLIYQKIWGLGYPYGLLVMGDTILIICQAPGLGHSEDIRLVAFSMATNDTLWTRWYGDPSLPDIPHSICLNNDSTGFVIAYIKGFDQTWMMDISFDGAVRWDRRISLGERDQPVKVLSRGGLGYWLAAEVERNNDKDVALAKISSAGILDDVSFAGFDSADDFANSAILVGNGGIVLVGATEYAAIGGTDPVLWIFDPSGSFQRIITWGDLGEGTLMTLQRVPGTGVMAFGYTLTSNFQVTAVLFSESLSVEGSIMFGSDQSDETPYGIFPSNDWTLYGVGRTTYFGYLFEVGIENAISEKGTELMSRRLIWPTVARAGQHINVTALPGSWVVVHDLTGREVSRFQIQPGSTSWTTDRPGVYFFDHDTRVIKVIIQ